MNTIIQQEIQTLRNHLTGLLSDLDALEKHPDILAAPESPVEPRRLTSDERRQTTDSYNKAGSALFGYAAKTEQVRISEIPVSVSNFIGMAAYLNRPIDNANRQDNERAREARDRSIRVAAAAKRVPSLLREQEDEVRRKLGLLPGDPLPANYGQSVTVAVSEEEDEDD